MSSESFVTMMALACFASALLQSEHPQAETVRVAPEPPVVETDHVPDEEVGSPGKSVAAVPDLQFEIPEAEEEKLELPWTHSIRAYNSGSQYMYYQSAVPCGDGRFVTAAHLVRGLGSQYRCEVYISGEWVPASFTPVSGKDLAIAKVDRSPDGPEGPLLIRAPEYGERVRVHGMEMEHLQEGFVSRVSSGNDSLVSLDAECQGSVQGDSGGGVY